MIRKGYLLLGMLLALESNGWAQSCYYFRAATGQTYCQQSRPTESDPRDIDSYQENTNCRCGETPSDLIFTACQTNHISYRYIQGYGFDKEYEYISDVGDGRRCGLCPEAMIEPHEISSSTPLGTSCIPLLQPDDRFGGGVVPEGNVALDSATGARFCEGYVDLDTYYFSRHFNPACCLDQDGDAHGFGDYSPASCGYHPTSKGDLAGGDCDDGNPAVWAGCSFGVTNVKAEFDPDYLQRLSEQEIDIERFVRNETIGKTGPDLFYGKVAIDGSVLRVSIEGTTEPEMFGPSPLSKQKIKLSLLEREIPSRPWKAKRIRTLSVGDDCTVSPGDRRRNSLRYVCEVSYQVPRSSRGSILAFRAQPLLEDSGTDDYWKAKSSESDSVGVAQNSTVVTPMCIRFLFDRPFSLVFYDPFLAALGGRSPHFPLDLPSPQFPMAKKCFDDTRTEGGGSVPASMYGAVDGFLERSESTSRMQWFWKFIFANDTRAPFRPDIDYSIGYMQFTEEDVQEDQAKGEIAITKLKYFLAKPSNRLELISPELKDLIRFQSGADVVVHLTPRFEGALSAPSLSAEFEGKALYFRFENANVEPYQAGIVYYRQRLINMVSDVLTSEVLLHEFGHLVGHLADEYSLSAYRAAPNTRNLFPLCCTPAGGNTCGESEDCDGMPHSMIDIPEPYYSGPEPAPLLSVMGPAQTRSGESTEQIYPVTEGDYCGLRSFPAGKCSEREGF